MRPVRRTGDRRRDFVGFLETVRAPDELLTEIRVPKTGPAGFNYQKFNRRAQDWAIVGALAVRNGATRAALREHGHPGALSAVEEALAAGASIADAADRSRRAANRRATSMTPGVPRAPRLAPRAAGPRGRRLTDVRGAPAMVVDF